METKKKKEIKEKGVVHFTIGEDFGKLLMDIAQEHLIYSLDPVKALQTLTDNLMGLSTELAIKILKGDMVLSVDQDSQKVILRDRIEGLDDYFPRIDVVNWYKDQSHKILKTGQILKRGLDDYLGQIRYRKTILVEIDYNTILAFINGERDQIAEDIFKDDKEVSNLSLFIKTVKEYITKSIQTQVVMNWMRKTYISEFEGDSFYVPDYKEYNNILTVVMQKFQAFCNLDFKELDEQEADLLNYIDSAIEIDKVIERGIEPVDIMENWSAGWLSPSGEYYALNGEIANMLHIQIAEALQEKGIVPKETEDSYRELAPYIWLEQNGWVKIHGNNIHFAGCLNDKLGKPVVDISPIQIKIIAEYGRICHNSLLKVGWKLIRCTSTMFLMQAQDLKVLYNTYFNF